MVPVLGYEGATGADYQRLMKGGFLLQYAVGDCDACVDSGGMCRINTTYDVLECHCSCGVIKVALVLVLYLVLLAGGTAQDALGC